MSVRYTDDHRAAKRLSWALLLTIGVAMTVSLYYVKTRAQSAKSELRQLRVEIERETAAIKVLEAELAYLSGPERLEKLNTGNLHLVPILPDSTRDLSQIGEMFPLREADETLAAQP